jgi:GlpG protein
MRLIGTDREAKRFSAYLRKKGIESSVDGDNIWVHNEDQIEQAEQLFAKFQANRQSPEYDVAVSPDDEVAEEMGQEMVDELTPPRIAHFTSMIIAFCAVLFFLSSMQEIPLLEKGVPPDAFVPTSIQSTLLFDIPPVFEKLQQTLDQYNPQASRTPPPLPANIQEEIAAVDKAPYWRGISNYYMLKWAGKDSTIADGPLFTDIRKGEVWRLLTPVFLHGSILHILFNMIWVWILGKQIELRIGISRYLILSVIIGVLTNTLQYLVSGPFFLGYSGIIMGLAGFIWSREKVAPWEGYPLHRSMILFLVLFVVAMFALEITSVVYLLVTTKSFGLNIANAAHIGGAVIGALLGRLNFFEARPG